jgi:PEP-CTERM motif
MAIAQRCTFRKQVGRASGASGHLCLNGGGGSSCDGNFSKETVVIGADIVPPTGASGQSSLYDGTLLFAAPITGITAVPEPSTWAMMILGFAGVGFMAYRRKAKASNDGGATPLS